MKINSPPTEYFEREPSFISHDSHIRGISNGKLGFYDGRYVDLEKRIYVSEKIANKVITRAILSLADNPCLSFRETHPNLADCCSHSP